MIHLKGLKLSTNATVMEPAIVFENNDVLVINKPAGLIVHGDGKTTEPNLADWVIQKYPSMAEVGEPWHAPSGEMIPRPGIVHRLDRDTSGVMILAKTPEAFIHLKEQFQERHTEKLYHAFVYGLPKEDGGVIDRPIGKSRSDFRLWSAQRGARGELRDALTEWRVLKRGEDRDTHDPISLLEVKPKTGRTHQIRVHLKAINYPVICDSLYAPKRLCLLGFTRTALHASMLVLRLPGGAVGRFEAPYPPDFQEAERRMS